MGEAQARSAEHWRAAHGGVLLGALALATFVPALAQWPWYLLAPLTLYAIVVLSIPHLRHSVRWLRMGRFDWPILTVTLAIILASCAVLALYYQLFHPDLNALAEMLPIRTALPLALAGACFAVGNAVMEEIIFRGVLQDALTSQLGLAGGVVAQAAVFGLGHMDGYPPGAAGAGLAAIYGLLLGVLREWARGLGCGILAHVCADATIFVIVAGAV